MEFNSDVLWFGLRGCLFCGSLWRLADGHCPTCSENLWSWTVEGELYVQPIEPSESEQFRGKTLSGVEVASLFQWIPGEQQVLSRLIMALKGPGGRALWNFYAAAFWRRYVCSHMANHKQILIIPCPSRPQTDRFGLKQWLYRRPEADHALLFSQGLAESTGASICNVLQRETTTRAQKTKTKSQREKVHFEWAENFSPERFESLAKGKKVIFVDDIVTTGATARAAWVTLGKPKDFAIWSLAQRSLSCGASTDLV